MPKPTGRLWLNQIQRQDFGADWHAKYGSQPIMAISLVGDRTRVRDDYPDDWAIGYAGTELLAELHQELGAHLARLAKEREDA